MTGLVRPLAASELTQQLARFWHTHDEIQIPTILTHAKSKIMSQWQALDLWPTWLDLSQSSTPGFKPQQLLPFLVTGTIQGLKDTHCGIAPAFDRKGKLSLSESVELAPGKIVKVTAQL